MSLRSAFKNACARKIAAIAAPVFLAATTMAHAGPALESRLSEADIQRDILMWPDAARQNPRDVCIVPGDAPTTATDNTNNLRAILSLLQTTPFGRQLVDSAREHNTLFCTYDRLTERGFFDTKLNFMMVHDGLEFGQQALIVAHELRHHWQHRQGFERSLKYSRKEAIRFTFAIEADAQALATLLAWQTRAAGDSRVWDGLMSIENYNDTGKAFAAAMDGKDPNDETAQRAATAAAFTAWIDNEWLSNGYWMQAMHMYLDEMDETKKIEQFTHAPLSYYAPLCAAPGDFYDCLSVIPDPDELNTRLFEQRNGQRATPNVNVRANSFNITP